MFLRLVSLLCWKTAYKGSNPGTHLKVTYGESCPLVVDDPVTDEERAGGAQGKLLSRSTCHWCTGRGFCSKASDSRHHARSPLLAVCHFRHAQRGQNRSQLYRVVDHCRVEDEPRSSVCTVLAYIPWARPRAHPLHALGGGTLPLNSSETRFADDTFQVSVASRVRSCSSHLHLGTGIEC